MSATSSIATQQKFTNLRKRLDQLGYRQPLGIESLPLVERLFADLIHTTDSLKNAKLKLNKSGGPEKGNVAAQIEPYRSDNAKLVKETNELHQQLIKNKEDTETTIKDLKSSLRKLEHENADLKFLNNQYVHKMRVLEKESKQKTERILQLQEKNFHAVVQTPGGRKKNIPFRRQRMEIDTTVPPSDPKTSVNPQVDDPYVADLLRLADDKIGQMEEDITLLRDEKEGSEGKIQNLRKQVDTRDGEIDRLSRLLEGGRPYDVVALETRNRSNERLISHLNIQIDYLQQKNQDLQKQYDTALAKAHLAADQTVGLDVRNAELEKELQDIDFMAQQLQLDKDTAVRSADHELEDAKIEVHKSRRELDTMDLQLAQFKAEKDRMADEIAELKSAMSADQADQTRLEQLLDKVQEDKRRLSQRVNKLTSNEKDLVLEIDRLKHKNGMVVKKKGRSPLDVFIKGLEEERDYWKGEVDVLQKLMRTKAASTSRPPSRSSSPSRSRSLNVTPIKTKSRSSSPSAKLKKKKVPTATLR